MQLLINHRLLNKQKQRKRRAVSNIFILYSPGIDKGGARGMAIVVALADLFTLRIIPQMPSS